MSKNKDIQFEDIAENIVNNLEKPIFTYEEKYDYKIVFGRVKKHFFNKARIKIILTFFIILTIIIYLCTRKFISLPIIIIISLILSIIITYLLVKKNAKNTSKNIDNKLLFYEDYLIIKSKNFIFNFSYEDISRIEETTYYFLIYIKKYHECIMIDKEKINNEFAEYLKKLQLNKNSNQKTNKTSENFFNSINKYFKDTANVFCPTVIGSNTLRNYFNFKYTKIRIVLQQLFFITPVIISIPYLLNMYYTYIHFQFHFSVYFVIIFIPIIVFVELILLYNKNINTHVNKSITLLKEKNIYFYKNFFLLRNDNSIIKYDYSKIKKVLNDNNNIFIITKINSLFKFINLYYPIMIDKKILKENEMKFIYMQNKNKQ